MSKMRIRNGPYAGREITLSDKPVTIGRDGEADVQILDRSASRVHSEIFPVGGMYFVRDLDSKNGTLINDERLADEELLREGDVVKIGSTELVFESGIALSDNASNEKIAYDDNLHLSNTIEIKIDDLSDIEDAKTKENQDDRFMRILYQTAKILSASESIDPVAQALDLIIQALPCDNANLLMRQGTSNKLSPRCIRSVNQWSKPMIARSIVKRALSENRAVLTENAQEDSRFKRQESVVGSAIRSAICVPLTIGSTNRGVFYVSRGGGTDPFTPAHLEVVSGCAVQLGMHFQLQEQILVQHKVLRSSMRGMLRCLELGTEHLGRSERCERIARATCTQLGIGESKQRNIELAAMLHHLAELVRSEDFDSAEHLGSIPGIEEALPLLRNAHERLDGSGPLGLGDTDLDMESRIVATISAYERTVAEHPGDDALECITRLEEGDTLDK
ncbi:MAG: FHA domain-containing protein, partial [Planctomycetota bacterium]